ncbi:hypothetical protein FUT87_00045 [Mitsuaria sp. TWR114]|uniref:chitinase n=1 Tax=Mitsuaria sp. TWR114 TaxID=2601731 RepID=UPI0011BE0523|nr:chitinase [Mitsuaria sp. TWR114]TXE00761.1 hypothetical protein FUT87_00045 [Mitsuaria sp. TWR114]
MTLSFPRLPLLARSILPPFLATSSLLIGAGPATAADGATGGHVLKQSALLADEARLTNGPLMTAIKRAIATLPNEQVEAIVPNRSANPANVRRVERLMSSADWDYLFPLRAPEYTYGGFLRAIGKFPAVCGDYTDGRDADAICRKTLATMFAHFAQETGAHESYRPEPEWRQGLRWVREMGWTEDMRGGYNGECNPATWQGKTWPCGTFANGDYKSYFGRGAKQLSYNYNYGPFSLAMFGSVRPLLDKPELVADTWLNLASAVFFYMYPQPPKPPMLFVVDGTWQPNARDLENGLKPGFGVTTQIINGGVECGGSVEVAQSLNRISYYRAFAAHFKVAVPADEVLGCKGMKQFDEGGAGATPIYWEQDYRWVPTNPEGRSYACKLVGYQTPHSALTAGDYVACVKHHFPDATIVDDRVQTWGSNDRKGTLDTVYEYQNPYTRQTEYFSLQGLGSDGRYWYFPTDKTNNRFWVYLGTDKNEALAANGRIAALQSWGANDRKAAIGDRFRYLNPHKPGLPMEVYELRATGSDGRYWYFPTTSSANTYWTYVGPAVTSAGSR